MRVTTELDDRVLDVARQMCVAYGASLPMDQRQREVVTQYAAIAAGARCSPARARAALARLAADGRLTVEVRRGRGVRLVCRA